MLAETHARWDCFEWPKSEPMTEKTGELAAFGECETECMIPTMIIESCRIGGKVVKGSGVSESPVGAAEKLRRHSTRRG